MTMPERKRARKPPEPLAANPLEAGVHHTFRVGVVARTECCDCGLVHRELFVVDPHNPTVLHNFAWRDGPATARAHKRRGDD